MSGCARPLSVLIFPWRVHADFLNGVDGRVRQRGKRQWHAEMIVEAGAAGMASGGLQHVGEHFLASGLADRAGDADKPAAGRDVGPAPAGTKLRQGSRNVVDNKQGKAGIVGGPRHERGCRALVRGGGDEIVPVGMCAGKGDEQAALDTAAAVDLDRCQIDRRALRRPVAAGSFGKCFGADPHGGRAGVHICSPPSVSRWMAFRATLESLKGSVSSPTS